MGKQISILMSLDSKTAFNQQNVHLHLKFQNQHAISSMMILNYTLLLSIFHARQV